MAFRHYYWSSMQLFCLFHRNCITRGFLFFFYVWDAIRFAVGNPVQVTRNRIAASRSKNVAALGKLLVTDFQDVKRIMQKPQLRGDFLGHFCILARQLPPSFLLFLQDPFTEQEATTNLHKLLREYIYENVIVAARKRVTDDKRDDFLAHVEEFLQVYRTHGSPTDAKKFKSVTAALNAMVVKYVFSALFGTALSKEDLSMVTDMVFGGSYPFSIVYGLGRFFQSQKLSQNLDRAVQLVEDSPAMATYEPLAANGNRSKREVAQLLFSIAALAGMIGTKTICRHVLTYIPDEYPLDVQDETQVLRAIVEAARLGAPVGEFHILLPHDETFQVHGKPLVFPQGTPVCVSISGATHDADEFSHPSVFDPTRSNLLDSCLNFNAPGFCPGRASGMRECLGRDIFLQLCTDLLVLKRRRQGQAAAAGGAATGMDSSLLHQRFQKKAQAV